MLLVAISYQP